MVDLAKTLASILSLLGLLVLPDNAFCENGDHFPSAEMDIWLGNVVHILAGTNQGFGLIVGRDANTVWIATASHVVTRDDPVSGLAVKNSPIKVIFRQGLEPAIGDEVKGSFRSGDLAFVSVKAPLGNGNFDPSSRQIVGVDLGPDTLLVLSGFQGAIGFDTKTGQGIFDGQAAGVPKGAVGIGLKGEEAQSGAAVASPSGIVGIYIGISDKGYMIPIDVVRQGAADAGVPWDLVSHGIEDKKLYHFCIEQSGSERPTIRLLGKETFSLDSEGCLDAQRIPYRILLDEPWLVKCQPNPIVFDPESNSRVRVSCVPNIVGTWRSEQMGTLRIREKVFGPSSVAPNVWTFEGLNLANDGPFVGEIRPLGNGFQLSGKSDSGVDISGNMTIGQRHADGMFMNSNGFSYDLRLSR